MIRATYRLQFHKGFTFSDAAEWAEYFAALGVSHIYSSPILTARAGSRHGYDVVDHAHINPELGGEEGFRAFASTLKQHGIGIILDIVPNHVAVGGADNPWWLDLLEKGRASRYADYFDIDWDAPGLENKVFAPFLGEAPQAALAKGDLKLVREAGKWTFAYFDHRFPLRPEDQDNREGDPEALLARQNFVLADWREADARLNWRRFFDITDLAAMRPNEPEVFQAIHAKIFALYGEDLIQGVRVDHVDGIADPGAYCRTLRARLDDIRPGAYIVVEKILADGEILPTDWQVDGTTGYDFMNEISALEHQPDDGVLESIWQRESARGLSFEQEEQRARHEMLLTKFA
jgi:(1->4)-alpha-D-glucan 1-alpha-D-glucosylmutase